VFRLRGTTRPVLELNGPHILPTSETVTDLCAVAGEPEHLVNVTHDDAVTDLQARTLASIWRGISDADTPALAALADTGAIAEGAASDLQRDLLALQRAASTESEQTSPITPQTQLAALLVYVTAHGPRGPVPGWQAVPVLDPREESMLPWTEEHTLVHGTQPSTNGHHHPVAALPATSAPDADHGHREALFDQIGGARAIEDLVETFYAMMMSDPQLAHYFAGFSVAKIKQHQHMFLTAVTGGPNIYVGRPLRVAHAALQISGPHFDRTAGHLDAALTAKGIDPDQRGLILARVSALRRHIASS